MSTEMSKEDFNKYLISNGLLSDDQLDKIQGGLQHPIKKHEGRVCPDCHSDEFVYKSYWDYKDDKGKVWTTPVYSCYKCKNLFGRNENNPN